jgi:predicted ATPase/DNA-binding winged helix-turn-helix (wHTH) protein
VSPSIRFGNAEIRPSERQLLIDGRPAALGSRAFDVLLALVERRERLVRKNELLDLVWPDTVVEENNLQSQVSQLRKVLGPQVISTIPGRGYRFTAAVDKSPSSGTAAAPQAADAPRVEASPAPTATPLRTNLPALLPSLIGRDDDMLALGALIDRHRGTHRLVTIAGAGGIGKTRLAQVLLHERTGAFAHGVCCVDLAPVTDPRQIADTIATALGVPTAVGDATEALIRTVAPLEILVLLDNAEHLLDEVARIALHLLACAPGLQLLVTSQAPLKVAEERIYRLGALALPDDDVDVEEALTFGAVALFVDRAQAADRRFALDAANVETVIDICRRLDGHPLALEFAAARVPLLGVHRLATSLGERLRLLTAGSRGAPARQQTLRAALEWSHGLASPVEQVVFRRLGVLAGSSTLELVQQVVVDDAIDAWAAVEALGGLVDRSLVGVSADEPPRYRLLDSPRVFARERLAAAGEFDTVAARHARAVRSLFESACDSLIRSATRWDAAFAAMDADLDNAQAALKWAQGRDEQTAASLMIGIDIHVRLTGAAFLDVQRHVIEVNVPYEQLPCGQLSVWSWAVSRSRGAAALPAGRDLVNRAIAHARAHGDVPALAVALAGLAECLEPGGREAKRVFDELHSLDDPDMGPLARCPGAVAEAGHSSKLGDVDAAIASLDRGLALISQTGVRNGIWIVQSWLIGIKLVAGRTAEVLADGLPLLEQLQGTRNETALALCRHAVLYALLVHDDLVRARSLAQVGWRQAARFPQLAHAAWPDLLALLAALERRHRTAAKLLGVGDAGWARTGRQRGPTTLRIVQRAESLTVRALGGEAFAHLRREGALLRSEDVAAIAFAVEDIS